MHFFIQQFSPLVQQTMHRLIVETVVPKFKLRYDLLLSLCGYYIVLVSTVLQEN
jgi:hypothetical protein